MLEWHFFHLWSNNPLCIYLSNVFIFYLTAHFLRAGTLCTMFISASPVQCPVHGRSSENTRWTNELKNEKLKRNELIKERLISRELLLIWALTHSNYSSSDVLTWAEAVVHEDCLDPLPCFSPPQELNLERSLSWDFLSLCKILALN